MPSTVIRSFKYDEASRTLLITFQSGRRYRYIDVPAETAEEMRGAFAKGGFFNSRIRGRFTFEKELPDTSE
jgi:KTSC domain